MANLSNIKNIHKDVQSLEPTNPVEGEVWVRQGHKYVYVEDQQINLFSDQVGYPE